jgi:hypothetical protein
MPNGPRRAPLVTREIEHDSGYEDGLSQDRYTLRVDAGTKDYNVPGGASTPVVKYGGDLTVVHQPNRDTYAYRGEGWSHRNHEFSGHRSVDMKQAASYDLMHKAGQTPRLFGSTHQEGTSSVDYLQSTKSARVHAPMLLAMAKTDTETRFPKRTLGASDDRSDFSEKIVGHLEGKLGTQFGERQRTNFMEFYPELPGDVQPREHAVRASATRLGNYSTEQYLVPQGHIDHARKLARETLRPSKAKKTTPSHQQFTLPFG